MRTLRHGWILFTILAAMTWALPACDRLDNAPGEGIGPAAQAEKADLRIVAVGDVHGDYDQFVAVLRAAKVIDKENKWIGGATRLVQTGDVLDRGADSRKAMDLLMTLEKQAAAAGGAVHALIGNHEAMVLDGAWHYVHPGEVEAFGGEEQYRQAMSAKGVYGKWIRSHDAVVKVGDTIFLHAGLRALFADASLAEINTAVRKELDGDMTTRYATDANGPLWDRFYCLGDEDDVAAELADVLKVYGAKRMVVGHTVTNEGVVTRAGGRLIRIDVGMSGHYGGPAACLVIEKGVCYEVIAPDVKRKLETETPAELSPSSALPTGLKKAA
jgi:hypothetical protein